MNFLLPDLKYSQLLYVSSELQSRNDLLIILYIAYR